MCIGAMLLVAQTLIGGCTSAPVDKNKLSVAATEKLDPTAVQLIGDLTRVWGMQSQQVNGVSLVVGLPGTGSDPPPTIEREMLLAEMQRQEVDNPNSVLASPTTALVHVRGLIPPGAQRGDRFDIEVAAPQNSGASNLAGGWLMESRLHDYASINGKVAEGHLLALAQGDLLTTAVLEESVDDVSNSRGVVLGGGVVLQNRGYGLIVKADFASVQTSSRIGEAINTRFHIYHRGQKRGVANPRNDSYIELLVHPKYQDNVIRFMRVIQNIAIREGGRQRSLRLAQLREEIAQPSTAALAAIRLESLGADGIPVLKDATGSADAEIRFYAAEALAYQDEPDAVHVLGDAARREPAFRFRALAALGIMDSIEAHDELVDLMNEPSAETRYGAFRVLRKHTPFDPILGGKLVADKFHIHQVNASGPPLIHVSRRERAEIVLFGSDHYFAEPLVLFVGHDIVVRSSGPGRAVVRRLTAAEDDDQRIVTTQVASIVETAVEFGASYADVVEALTQAKRSGSLASRLEFSAIPSVDRVFSRDQAESDVRDSNPPDDFTLLDRADGLDPQEADSDFPHEIESPAAEPSTDSAEPANLRRRTELTGDAPTTPAHSAGGDQEPATNIPVGGSAKVAPTSAPLASPDPAPVVADLAPPTSGVAPPVACVPNQQITLPTQFVAVQAAAVSPTSITAASGGPHAAPRYDSPGFNQAIPVASPSATGSDLDNGRPEPPTAPGHAGQAPSVETGASVRPPEASTSKPKSPLPPAPEGVLPGVDLLDLIETAAPRRHF